ncbi:VirK/YbjX family protein [Rhodanobacter sp. Col0626]|uniref:VirK/YbjX family protein n=1 Tax=Rhodanobacter sp. Col0626 TaxID=3415679 RepID=UPI003CE8920B
MSPHLFWRSLRHRHDWRGSLFKRGGCAIKYAIRSARDGELHAAWLDFIYHHPVMTAMLTKDPRLLERPQHDYINRRLNRFERYAVIADHYRTVLTTFPPGLCESIYLHGQFRVGTLSLKDGTALLIELRRPTGRGREGELCLCLANATGQMLSSMIFSIADGGHTLLLGCVQGAAPALGREAVRDLTKQSHGLRPKNLLLSMVRALAQHNGAIRVRGVSNTAHPFAGQADKIKADYDSFWLECHGTLDESGFYELPAHEPVREEIHIPSKHRSAFRQREALRREACALLLATLDGREDLALVV